MKVECIRRDGSYWTTCRCQDCKLDAARKRKMHYVGYRRRVTHEDAWSALAARFEDGWSAAAVASATNRPATYFSRHLAQWRRGGECHIGPALAVDIINMGTPTAGQVGATPSRRRLQALARIGYGLKTLSERTGIGFTTLAMVRGGTTQRVGALLAATVADIYTDLHTESGADEVAIRDASSKSWPPPAAWLDIDDPNERPDPGYRPVHQRQRHELLTEWAHLGGLGVSIHQAARQLGVTVEAIEVAMRREGAA